MAYAERSKPQRYSSACRGLRWVNTPRCCLVIFSNFPLGFISILHLIQHSCYTLPLKPYLNCHSFLHEGKLLQTLLSRINFFIDSIEEITEGVISCVQELFQVDGFASTPPPSPLESQTRRDPFIVWNDHHWYWLVSEWFRHLRKPSTCHVTSTIYVLWRRWLQTNHVCHMCPNPLPTLKN